MLNVPIRSCAACSSSVLAIDYPLEGVARFLQRCGQGLSLGLQQAAPSRNERLSIGLHGVCDSLL